MKYIIDDEELQSAFWFALVNGIELDKGRTWAKDFLKDKKPVEMIDTAEVTGFSANSDTQTGGIYLISEYGNKFLHINVSKVAEYCGKNIEIYIKEL